MSVGIKEVAKKAGVSPSTVSRVLSGKIPVSDTARQRVLAAVKQFDYQPNPAARSLKGGSLKTIGLFVPNVRNLVFPAAIRGIEDVAQKYGYTLVLCNTDEIPEKEAAYVSHLRRRLIDGFIVSTVKDGNSRFWSDLDEGFPVVYLIRHAGYKTDAVVFDNFAGAYKATQYLLEMGHRKIALINGNIDILLYRERFQGYCQALQDHGISLDEEFVVQDVSGWDESFAAMKKLLRQRERPDAVFATNDPKAIGVMRAIKDAGLKIPGDISVIGVDNSDIAGFLDPPLTTVAQPFYEMGAKACEKLIRIIEKKRRVGSKVEVFPAQLVVRDSVNNGRDRS